MENFIEDFDYVNIGLPPVSIGHRCGSELPDLARNAVVTRRFFFEKQLIEFGWVMQSPFNHLLSEKESATNDVFRAVNDE